MERYSKRQAKRDAVRLWSYIYEHNCDNKYEAFTALGMDIGAYSCECPLCEYYEHNKLFTCSSCPLARCTTGNSPYFTNWSNAINEDERKAAAKAILDKIKAWEVK